MKRIYLVIVLMLFSIVLAGCDLIPQDLIEQTTEELCRENPEHELCQADVFEQLEDDVILDYFNDLLLVLEDEENDTFCEDFFSVTNIDLLDECLEDRDLLLPSDINNFVATSVTKDGDYYKIETLNQETNEIVEFEVRIVLEEEKLLINDWTFTDSYQNEFMVTQEHIDSGLEMFLSDFEDDMITNEEFCAVWYDGIDQDCDGIEEARRKFKAGAALSKTVNVAEISDVEGNMVEAKIEFFFDGHVTVLKIALSVTLVENEVTYKISENKILLRGIEKEDIKRGIDLFIDDYSDEDITDDQLCAKWYDGIDNDCDGLVKARVKFKAGADLSKKVNIMDTDVDDDGYGDVTALIEFEMDGHVTVLKISFDVSEEDGMLNLMIKEENVLVRDFDEEVIKEKIMMFMSDFESGDIPTEQLCTMWFDGEDNDCDGIAEAQRRFKAGAALSKTVNIMVPDDDESDMVYATIEYEFRGHVTVLKISFTPSDDGEMVMLNIRNAEVLGDYNTYIETEIVSLYRMYLDNYFNPEISFEEINDMYYDNMMNDEFGRLRLLDIENKLVVNVLDENEIMKDEMGYFILSLEIVTGHGNTYTEINIKPIRLELSRIDLNPGDTTEDEYLSKTEVDEYFRMFLADYLDPDSDDDTIIDSYFGGNVDPRLLVEREMLLADGTTITVTGISARSNFNVDSFFDITYELTTASRGIIRRVKIKVNRIDMAMVLDDDDDGDSIPTEDLRMMLEDFITKYNDPFVENLEACMMVTETSDEMTCESMRDMDMKDGYVITSYELFGDPDFGFDDTFLFGDPDFLYSVNFLIGDPDMDMVRMYNIDAYQSDDGNYMMMLAEMEKLMIDREYVNAQIANLTELLNDPRITVDTVCPVFFDDNSFDICTELVNPIVMGSYSVTINEISSIGDMYTVEFILENADGESIVLNGTLHFYISNEMINVMLHMNN